MSVQQLDPYQPGSSLVHELDARSKLPLALAFILVTALIPHRAWPVYLLLWALVLAATILSELGIPFVLKRSLVALPFVLAALPVLFTLPGKELFSFSVGSSTFIASQTGLERLISIMLKSWISVQCAILLAAATPFPELLAAMRSLRIPRLLVAIVGLMWRYLFVMVAEVQRLITARASRSGVSDREDLKPGGTLTWRARVAGGMAGNLLLRSFERSDRIYAAMLSRGYDGEVRTLPRPAFESRDWLVLAAGLALLLVLLLLGLLIG